MSYQNGSVVKKPVYFVVLYYTKLAKWILDFLLFSSQLESFGGQFLGLIRVGTHEYGSKLHSRTLE